MNLDDFKIQLNKKLEGSPSFEMVVTSTTNLDAIKTTSILQKIKKSLAFEIVFGIVFVLAFMFIAFFTNAQSMKIYFIIFSVVISIFIFILFFLFQKIKKCHCTKFPIKQHLLALHSLLTEFVKRCFQFTMLLLPICFAFSIYLAYKDLQYSATNTNEIIAVSLSKKYIILLSIFIIVFSVFVYFFTKWYLKKLYGNHLTHLKQMLDDIDS